MRVLNDSYYRFNWNTTFLVVFLVVFILHCAIIYFIIRFGKSNEIIQEPDVNNSMFFELIEDDIELPPVSTSIDSAELNSELSDKDITEKFNDITTEDDCVESVTENYLEENSDAKEAIPLPVEPLNEEFEKEDINPLDAEEPHPETKETKDSVVSVPVVSKATGISKCIKKPKPIGKICPKYPSMAKRLNISGVVFVGCEILTSGAVKRVWVERSSGRNDFDCSALEAVSNATFSPKMVDGIPEESSVVVPIEFKILY